MRKYAGMRSIACLAICGVLMTSVVSPEAATLKVQKTNQKHNIATAKGAYANWDGVSDGTQFLDNQGNVCIAYDTKSNIVIVKTKNGKPVKKTITLKKKSSVFGDVTCDSDGNFYVVTGKTNKTNNTETKTIFVSKYDANGKLLASVGNNGSSSLAHYNGDSFYTQTPFDGGNCDIAVNGDYVAVNYARKMYSGHQSNSLFLVNRKTMQKESVERYYNSHSFAQRVVPWGEGFLLASEGDCYDRAFTVSELKMPGTGDGISDDLINNTDFPDDWEIIYDNTYSDEASKTWTCDSQNIFSFWISKGAFDRYDMYEVNDNFARMGGIATGDVHNAAMVAISAPSLSSKAKKENQQLFIQIFDPNADLTTANGYITSGTRSGLSGKNGDENVTDYGVKWLTNYDKTYTIENPQVVATDAGNYVILFERYKKYSYQGVYAIVVDAKGNVIQKTKKLASSAYLTPSRMPVYSKGKVWWAGNKTKGTDIYIYSYAVR